MAVAILDNNATQFSTVAQATFTTTALTVSSGATLAVAYVTWGGGAVSGTVTVTLGGVSMTSVGAAVNQAAAVNCQLFYLIDPAAGTPTATVTMTDGQEVGIALTTWTGSNTTTPVRAGSYITSSRASGNPSITISSATGDQTTTVVEEGGGVAPTGSNQTVLNTAGTSLPSGFASLGNDRAAGAATVTHTWTLGSAVDASALAGFSIEAFRPEETFWGVGTPSYPEPVVTVHA